MEILFVREIMRTKVVALSGTASAAELAASLHRDGARRQRLYPVVEDGRLRGVVTRDALLDRVAAEPGADRPLHDLMVGEPVVAYPDESLRVVVYRMAQTGRTRLPVVERGEPRRLAGMISLEDLLVARSRNLEAELRRERVAPMQLFFPRSAATSSSAGARS